MSNSKEVELIYCLVSYLIKRIISTMEEYEEDDNTAEYKIYLFTQLGIYYDLIETLKASSKELGVEINEIEKDLIETDKNMVYDFRDFMERNKKKINKSMKGKKA